MIASSIVENGILQQFRYRYRHRYQDCSKNQMIVNPPIFSAWLTNMPVRAARHAHLCLPHQPVIR